MAQTFVLKAVIEARDRLSPTLRTLRTRLAPLRSSFANVGSAARSLASGVWSVVKPLGLMAAAGVVGLALLAKRIIDTASELHDFLQQVQFAPQAFQELEYAFGQSGVSSEDFRMAIEKLSKNMGAFKTGTGALATILKKHASPAFVAQLKHAKGNAEAFDILMAAIMRESDVQKRAVLIQAAFGKSSQKMLALLSEGPEAVAALRAEYQRLGRGLSGAELNAMDEAGDAIGRMQVALLGVKNSIAVHLLPALTPLIDRMGKLIAKNRGLITQRVDKAFKEIAKSLTEENFKALVKDLSELVAGLVTLGRGARMVVRWLGGVKNTIVGLGVLTVAPLLLAVGKLGVSIWSLVVPAFKFLAVVIATMLGVSMGWAVAIIAAVALAAAAVWKYWTPIKAFLISVWEGALAAAKKFLAFVQRIPKLDFIPGVIGGKAALRGVGAIARGVQALGRKALDNVQSAPYRKGAPLRTGGGAPARESKSQVTIEFKNAPPGTRVRTAADPMTDLMTDMGLNLRGASAGAGL